MARFRTRRRRWSQKADDRSRAGVCNVVVTMGWWQAPPSANDGAPQAIPFCRQLDVRHLRPRGAEWTALAAAVCALVGGLQGRQEEVDHDALLLGSHSIDDGVHADSIQGAHDQVGAVGGIEVISYLSEIDRLGKER